MAGWSPVCRLYRRDHHTGSDCLERPHICFWTMAWDFACLGHHWILRYIQHRPSQEITSGRGNNPYHPPDGILCRYCAAVGPLTSSDSHWGAFDLHKRRRVAYNWSICHDWFSHTHGLLMWVWLRRPYVLVVSVCLTQHRCWPRTQRKKQRMPAEPFQDQWCGLSILTERWASSWPLRCVSVSVTFQISLIRQLDIHSSRSFTMPLIATLRLTSWSRS